MTDEAAWAEFRAKREALDVHPGRLARHRWDAIRRVRIVLVANEVELCHLIEAFETNNEFAIEVMRNIGQTGAQELYFNELFRRMHNYLSAVKMLVEHTRNLVRNYPGSPFVEEYRERIASIAARGRGPLLQKLRDYLVHYRIPPFGTAMNFSRNSETFIVYLDRDAALEFNDWPAAAKAFLQEQPNHIPLTPLVREYSSELEDLYTWLFDQFEGLHGADVDAFNALLVDFQGAENTPGHPDYRPLEIVRDETASSEP